MDFVLSLYYNALQKQLNRFFSYLNIIPTVLASVHKELSIKIHASVHIHT